MKEDFTARRVLIVHNGEDISTPKDQVCKKFNLAPEDVRTTYYSFSNQFIEEAPLFDLIIITPAVDTAIKISGITENTRVLDLRLSKQTENIFADQ